MVIRRAVLVMLVGLVFLAGCSANDWRNASREPAGIATPATSPEAVIEVFAADAYGWRGIVAVHTWIAVKPANANEYTALPGPNSNTFPAWIARAVPELGLELPFSAIGKGYID